MNNIKAGPPYQIITWGSGDDSSSKNGTGNLKQDVRVTLALIITLVALDDFLLQLHFQL